jgi:hypothetical protein
MIYEWLALSAPFEHRAAWTKPKIAPVRVERVIEAGVRLCVREGGIDSCLVWVVGSMDVRPRLP